MAAPIQKRLLIHTATLKGDVTRDEWQNVSESTDISLTYIRIDRTDKLIQSKTNQEKQLTAVIFYDMTHSRPQNVTFAQDQPIVFDGEEHRINRILPVYDDKRLHHYELEVI